MRPFGLARRSFSDLRPLHLQAVDAQVDRVRFGIHEGFFRVALGHGFPWANRAEGEGTGWNARAWVGSGVAEMVEFDSLGLRPVDPAMR